MSQVIKLFLSITNNICTYAARKIVGKRSVFDVYFCLLFVFAFVFLCVILSLCAFVFVCLYLSIIFNVILLSRLAKSWPAALPCPIFYCCFCIFYVFYSLFILVFVFCWSSSTLSCGAGWQKVGPRLSPVPLLCGKANCRGGNIPSLQNQTEAAFWLNFFFSLYIHPHISEGGSRGVTSIISYHSYVGGWGTISATINCTKCIWKFAHTYLRHSDWHRRRNANILILKSSFYKFTWYLWI